jgi:hypothetical protein
MGRGYLKEVGVDVRIIFEWIFKKCHRVDCSGSVLGEMAGAFVNVVMNIRVS